MNRDLSVKSRTFGWVEKKMELVQLELKLSDDKKEMPKGKLIPFGNWSS
ncbi:hypothetical protein [Algoriphagus yeomjeoni]|nr:hypothetical protein [Algoriphagus yeomjeoni]